MAAALGSQIPLALYYDHDTRREVADCSHAIKRLASSVACLIPPWLLNENPNGSYSFKNIQNLTDMVLERTGYPLTDEATFRDQACPGTGTAFAVTRNTVMTAGHCVAGILQNKMKIVFNFCLERETFAANEVYDVKNIIYDVTDRNVEKSDWAWMKLDRDIEGRDPLPIDMTSPKINDFVSLIGHPSGISMKYCDGTVESNHKETYFNAKLDSFQGNSGSPILNSYNKVIGILYAGIPDYEFRENYKGTGKKKAAWRVITQIQIDKGGYPRCHRIAKTMFAVARKISAVGLYTLNEKIDRSNWHSAVLFKSRQHEEDWCNKHKFLDFVARVANGKFLDKEKSEHEMIKIQKNLCYADINYAEADILYKEIEPANDLKVGLKEIPNFLRNMSAYQITIEEAFRISEFEECFEKWFETPYSRESVQALLRE